MSRARSTSAPWLGPIRRAAWGSLGALLIALCVGGIAHAQTPETTVAVTVERDGRTVGDPIAVIVTVDHPTTWRVVTPVAPQPLGALESALATLDPAPPAPPAPPADADGVDRVRSVLRYATTAFDAGTLLIAVPPIVLINAAGETTEIAAPRSAVQIDSVLPVVGDPPEPRPLKPPLSAGRAGLPIVTIGAVVGVVVGLAIVAVTLRRRTQRRRATPLMTPPVDPATATLATLEQISAAGLLPDRPEQYCEQIDAAVRDYLRRRYAIPAQNLTAAELSDGLERVGADHRTVQIVRNLCAECDAVIFGAARPAPERMQRYLDLARSVLHPDATLDSTSRWARPATGGGD